MKTVTHAERNVITVCYDIHELPDSVPIVEISI